MEILNIKENEDGSCILECEFSQDEVNILINYAVNHILKEKLKEIQKEEIDE